MRAPEYTGYEYDFSYISHSWNHYHYLMPNYDGALELKSLCLQVSGPNAANAQVLSQSLSHHR